MHFEAYTNKKNGNAVPDPYMEELHRFADLPNVKIMGQFSQHKTSNTLAHVCHVATVSHKIEKALFLHVDEEALLKGAMLHDYYLYDFHQHPVSAYRHGTGHAVIALTNAEKVFPLNSKERNIIYSHMWPLNLTHIPKCREAWIVTVADKICAIEEMFLDRLPFRQGNSSHEK
ncbi:MAG: HD domain-containing protein [Eubacterium sp.]|nr:HD domain-containing protein [Eubacterium sp.]